MPPHPSPYASVGLYELARGFLDGAFDPLVLDDRAITALAKHVEVRGRLHAAGRDRVGRTLVAAYSASTGQWPRSASHLSTAEPAGCVRRTLPARAVNTSDDRGQFVNQVDDWRRTVREGDGHASRMCAAMPLPAKPRPLRIRRWTTRRTHRLSRSRAREPRAHEDRSRVASRLYRNGFMTTTISTRTKARLFVPASNIWPSKVFSGHEPGGSSRGIQRCELTRVHVATSNRDRKDRTCARQNLKT